VHSPKIEKLEVQAVGDVNRAKLYYLREKVGRKARVREQQRGERLSSAGAPPPSEDEPEEAAEEVAEAAEDGEEAPSV
jgi:large subunit ribosomal protein L19